MAIIAGVAFATILAVVAGLTITASASFAHDIYNSVIKDGKADPAKEVKVAALDVGDDRLHRHRRRYCGHLARTSRSSSRWLAVAASANSPSILGTRCTGRGSRRRAPFGRSRGLIFKRVDHLLAAPRTRARCSSTDFACSRSTPGHRESRGAGRLFLGWLGSVLKPGRRHLRRPGRRDGGLLHDRRRRRGRSTTDRTREMPSKPSGRSLSVRIRPSSVIAARLSTSSATRAILPRENSLSFQALTRLHGCRRWHGNTGEARHAVGLSDGTAIETQSPSGVPSTSRACARPSLR